MNNTREKQSVEEVIATADIEFLHGVPAKEYDALIESKQRPHR